MKKNEHYSVSIVRFVLGISEECRSVGRTSSSHTYKALASALSRFGCPDKMTMDELTPDYIRKLLWFMKGEGLSPNSIALYLRLLKSAYNIADEQGMIYTTRNPFRHISMKTEKTGKRAIDKKSLTRLLDLDLSHSYPLALCRDLFLFSFFARGMPFVDTVFLRTRDIKGDAITYRRRKTGRRMTVKISERMKEIIDKTPHPYGYMFPILDPRSDTPLYTQYKTALRSHNRNLGRLSEMAGLNGRVTSYVARHSWATIAKRSGIPVSVISEGLGHSDEKTTSIYLDSFKDDTVDRANEIVTDLNIREGCLFI